MTTYSVKQIVLDADPLRKVMVTKYITLASGLTWQQAKALRKGKRMANIVPERPTQEVGQ